MEFEWELRPMSIVQRSREWEPRQNGITSAPVRPAILPARPSLQVENTAGYKRAFSDRNLDAIGKGKEKRRR